MEISEQTIVELVRGQGEITQAIKDLDKRMDKTLPYLADQDEKNAKAIRGVERKLYYFGGAGSVLGYIGSHWIEKFFGLGGK